MGYEEKSGTRLDLSSSGRGLQQTLLILAHIYANPRTVLLLDEPDAHLEVLRQRQTYQLITDIAEEKAHKSSQPAILKWCLPRRQPAGAESA